MPNEGDQYYLAFDLVYDNMDVMNKYLELRELAAVYPKQVIILDMICFEHIILSFSKLIEWTGTRKKNKITMREMILSAIEDHKIVIDRIVDEKTRDYLFGFKRYSTERAIKAITYELTENDGWSVKGKQMGDCWYRDCCVSMNTGKTRCGIRERALGEWKIVELLSGIESQKIMAILYE